MVAPWEEVAVNLIGPWPASTPHGILELFALNCIDTTTNLVEITQIFEKSSVFLPILSISGSFRTLNQCESSIGGEFTGFACQQLLCLLNIKLVPTTSKNPQANAICKQMHQTVGTVLKTLLLAQPPQSCCQAALLADDALATALHTLHSTVLTMLQAMPRGLAFSQLSSSSTFLFLQSEMPFLRKESNWSIIHCSLPTKGILILIIRLVNKFSSMTKRFKASFNQRLQDPLTFAGPTLMAR